VIFAYFYDYLGATARNVGGVVITPIPVQLEGAGHLLTTHPAAGSAPPAGRAAHDGTVHLRRIGLALITLWLLSVLVFFLVQLLPGNVAS
jgi:hypothetical protein